MIKRNTNVKSQVAIRRRIAVAVSLLVIAAAACSGLAIGGGALSAIWREQFRVQDSAIDVVVTSSGKNVKPDTIIYYFGLTNGANLATIPYENLRKGLIARIPNIKDIKVERRLPRRVTVDVKEREPAVRIAPAKGSPSSGLVADYDGVVFRTFNSPPLPIIREAADKRHDPGHSSKATPAPRCGWCTCSQRPPTQSRTRRPSSQNCASSKWTPQRKTTS